MIKLLAWRLSGRRCTGVCVCARACECVPELTSRVNACSWLIPKPPRPQVPTCQPHCHLSRAVRRLMNMQNTHVPVSAFVMRARYSRPPLHPVTFRYAASHACVCHHRSSVTTCLVAAGTSGGATFYYQCVSVEVDPAATITITAYPPRKVSQSCKRAQPAACASLPPAPHAPRMASAAAACAAVASAAAVPLGRRARPVPTSPAPARTTATAWRARPATT